MKRKVLSFDQFIFEAYKMMNEGASFSDVKQKLSDKLNANGQKALNRMEDAIKSSADLGLGVKTYLAYAGEIFDGLIQKLDGKNKKLESVDVDVQYFDYKKLVQGKVYISKTGGVDDDPAGGAFKLFKIKDGKCDLNGLISAINLGSVSKKKGNMCGISKERGGFIPTDDKGQSYHGVYRGTQLSNCYVLTDIGSNGFEFSYNNATKIYDMYRDTKVGGPNEPDKEDKKIGKASKDSLTFGLPLYVLLGVVPGGGDGISIETLEKKITIIKGGDETADVDIADNGTLFTVNKSDLKEEGKINISNAIQNNFSSVSSIEVIGGASQEGSEARNKQLCKERAEAVAEYLKTICKGAITVSEKANIQPKESTEDRKTWRRVTLKIKGQKIVGQNKDEEKIEYVARAKDFRADLAKMAQVTLYFNVEYTEA